MTRPVGAGPRVIASAESMCVCRLTLGDEKLSLGKTAPYSFMHSRIFMSSSGNAKCRLGLDSSSSESSSLSLSPSSSEMVL